MARQTFFSGQKQNQNKQVTGGAHGIKGSCGTVTLYLATGALGVLLGQANACKSNDGIEREPTASDFAIPILVCAGGIVGVVRTINAIEKPIADATEVVKAVGMMCAEFVKGLMP